MGGNALTKFGINTRRVEADEYKTIAAYVEPLLRRIFRAVHVVRTYKNKKDFGDIDILVSDLIDTGRPIKEQLEEQFCCEHMYCNGPVYSFAHDNFQVDVIKTKPKFWETSKVYYAYNDLGNFMGRIAHKMGFKYGHAGLTYMYRTEANYIVDDITISTDPRKIFEFLGFDYDRFEEGFDEIEDVWDYVIQSPNFSSEAFAYENLNHENRVRNRKRKSYAGLVDYIQEMCPEKKFKYDNKGNYILQAQKKFGLRIFSMIGELKQKEELIKQFRSKFNGKIIMELIPELKNQGKRLGEFIKFIKNQYNTGKVVNTKNESLVDKLPFEDFIRGFDQVEVDRYILAEWENFE